MDRKKIHYPRTWAENVVKEFFGIYYRGVKILADDLELKMDSVFNHAVLFCQRNQDQWVLFKKTVKSIYKCGLLCSRCQAGGQRSALLHKCYLDLREDCVKMMK